MKLYTIFFKTKNKMLIPVIEGKDGNYWLGGSNTLMNVSALIFGSAREANNACADVIERIKTDEKEHKYFKDGSFVVKRIDLTPTQR